MGINGLREGTHLVRHGAIHGQINIPAGSPMHLRSTPLHPIREDQLACGDFLVGGLDVVVGQVLVGGAAGQVRSIALAIPFAYIVAVGIREIMRVGIEGIKEVRESNT